MRRAAVFLSLIALLISLSLSLSHNVPFHSILCDKSTRVQWLTPRVIRLETGAFEDRASLAFVSRADGIQPEYTVVNTSQWCNVSLSSPAGSATSVVSFALRKGGALKANVFVSGQWSTVSTLGSWNFTYGDSAAGNLLGTLAPTPSTDLAGCCHNPPTGGWDPEYPLQPGLLSRDGWAVIDDSQGRLLDDDGWIVPTSQGRQNGSTDLYIFGCGRDYKACLQDYSILGGKMNMPPLSAFGIWWSRHWGDSFDGNPFGDMTQSAIVNGVVKGYEEHSLPLHIVVMDMEWHSMLSTKDCETFIGKSGWGGYTWNTTLFPKPFAFVDYLHQRNISVSINFHPDSGIDHCQAFYKAMGEAIGFDTRQNATIPDFNPQSENKTYADAFFAIAINQTAVDYSWTDSPKVTTWTNHLFDEYMVKQNKRPLVLSRYGGLGNHRSPIGFSGDTLRLWDTLDYQIYMTSRASNVLFGYWSHDIGGFSGGCVDSQCHTESAQLFLRWLQFAVVAPIFRTHCRYCEQRIWTFPEPYFSWMRNTMLLRNTLVPYIYTTAYRQAYLNGRGLVSPMYYEFPDADEAYAYETQYMFGPALLAAPIAVQPQSTNTSATVSKPIWLPESVLWLNLLNGELEAGPMHLNRSYSLNQLPLFAKAGAVLPTRTLAAQHEPFPAVIRWKIIKGADEGAGELYEDEGDNMNYQQGQAALTTLSYVSTHKPTWSMEVAILPATPASANGSLPAGMPGQRVHSLELTGVTEMPSSALCNGIKLEKVTPESGPGYWGTPVNSTLTGSTMVSIVVECQALSISERAKVSVGFEGEQN